MTGDRARGVQGWGGERECGEFGAGEAVSGEFGAGAGCRECGVGAGRWEGRKWIGELSILGCECAMWRTCGRRGRRA